jgi:hypothetical protein
MGLETKGTFLGTPGYYPYKTMMDDGNEKWDVWALGAMILEADLETDVYLNVDSERVA